MGKIVVADDSDLDRELTRRALRKWAPEHEVFMFEDGESAVEFLKSADQVLLVLLDHRMPRLGAVEVMEALTAVPMGATFILFSSAVSPMNVERCRGLGVTDYVEKPTDPGEFSEVIRSLVTRFVTV